MSRREPSIPRTCEQCTGAFLVSPRDADRGRGRFCSRSCAITARHVRNRRPLSTRFWEKVEITETCWLWTGCTVGGYGHIRVNNKPVKAHRVSWEMQHEPISDGMFVCHSCDVRNCVNPDHLFLGTNTDNMNDMFAKGRGNRPLGERNNLTKLTASEVLEIRSRYAHGDTTYDKLAERFGVSKHAIFHVVKRHSWAWL